MTQLNVAALAALARAPMPPEPKVEGAVSTDTTLAWAPVPGADAYVVRWRPDRRRQLGAEPRVGMHDLTTAVPSVASAHGQCRVAAQGVRVDDWVFGVSSVAADGSESPVASAVPGGAFGPYTPPPPAAQQ